MTSDLTLKRIMELWEGIPVVYTITSIEGEWNTYKVHVQVIPSKIISENKLIEGNYIVKTKGGVL